MHFAVFGMVEATMFGWWQFVAMAVSAVASHQDKQDAKRAANAAGANQQTLDKISTEQWEAYKKDIAPLMSELSESVAGEADTQGASDRVSNDVIQSFAKAREVTNRNNMRLGINPASGAAQEDARRDGLDMAKTRAFAMNSAREAEKDKHFGRKMAVVQTGKGLPATALSAANSSMNQSNYLANQYNEGARNTARFVSGLPWDKMGSTGGGSQPSTYSAYSGTTEQAGNNFDNMNFDDISADSNKFADGGEVDGEGSGISDSIDAKLSDGEYVVPADVVKKKGTEFFDKLLEKHHVPAAMQTRGLPLIQQAG